MIKNVLFLNIIFAFISILHISACSQAYYGTLEKVGIHKRDILVDRVEAAKQSQEAARDQFQNALDQFSSVVKFDGGDLEDVYKRLDKELQKSEARADEVKTRIDKVEEVSEDLFAEWEQELEEYDSDKLEEKE